MKINDLIFAELLKRGYKIEGKTRVWNIADSKLWYLTSEQAQGYLDLVKTKDYRKAIIEKEVSLIKKHLKDFVKDLPDKSCNIIDLGCGDGKKAALFIEELAKHMKIRYCPIDISSYMVSKAAKTIREMKIGEVLEFKWNISDFENLDNITPLFRDNNFKTHFMMLLGNTLGNFERENMLHGIANSMGKDDVLLIGNGLSSRGKDWIKEYKNRLINKWLSKIPLQLGLTENDIDYDVRFVNSRVEEIYILKKDKTIKHLGKVADFKRGDVIVVAVSYKYAKIDLHNILQKFFSKVRIYTDAEESYALALCKK